MSLTLNGWYKDPSSVLDYAFDWSEWLGEEEVILTHSVTISPINHTDILVVDKTSATTHQVTAWLSSGRKNIKYTVSCEIITSEGRTETASIVIGVRKK